MSMKVHDFLTAKKNTGLLLPFTNSFLTGKVHNCKLSSSKRKVPS